LLNLNGYAVGCLLFVLFFRLNLLGFLEIGGNNSKNIVFSFYGILRVITMRDSLLLLCLLGIGALVADSAEVINLKKTLNEISRYVVAETSQFIEPEMVQLPNGSWMGKYEVTQAQWQAVMGNNPSSFKECGDNCPVEYVSWDDVQIYIQKLNEKTGKTYRLPTEEEWFAACQAGQTTEYCGSNNADEVAWYDGNSTHPVGQKTDNGWGLHDMSGNVWEWTSSLYDNEHDWRVLRGGSWYSGPQYLRSAGRGDSPPAYRYYFLGFRLSRM
jgi:hypothetical protein